MNKSNTSFFFKTKSLGFNLLETKTKGFTLFETLLAMMILATGIILLQQSWSSSTLRQNKMRILNEMGALLEQKMLDLELEYASKSLDSIPDEQSEDFGSDYPQYSWKMTSHKLEFPDISAALTAQDGGAAQELLTIMNQFKDHLGKSVKEVKMTIIYKGAKKNLEASATRYFIDYDREISDLMGAGTAQ